MVYDLGGTDFGEHISVQNIIGVLLVIAGTMIVNKEG